MIVYSSIVPVLTGFDLHIYFCQVENVCTLLPFCHGTVYRWQGDYNWITMVGSTVIHFMIKQVTISDHQ